MSEIGNAIGDVVDAVGGAVTDVAGAVGSAVGSVADGVGAVAGGAIDGLSGIGSIFGDVLESVGGVGQDVPGGIGGAVGDIANFLNPVDFFQNVGGLVGDLFAGPLGDIAKAITDPIFNFAEGIASFAKSVFSGDLLNVIKNTITDYPISQIPAEAFKESLANTADTMNGIFEAVIKLDPSSSDFPTQLANVQQQVQQLGATETLIGQMLDNINEMAKRINPFQ